MIKIPLFVILLILFGTKVSLQAESQNPKNDLQLISTNASSPSLQMPFFMQNSGLALEPAALKACDCPPMIDIGHGLDCSKKHEGQNVWTPSIKIMPNKPKGFQFILQVKEDGINDESWCPSSTFKLLNVSRSNASSTNYPIILDPHGTLDLGTRQINKSEYCVIRKSKETIFKICIRNSSSPNNGSILIKKCCAYDQVMDGNDPKKCITVTNQTHWYPIYYRDGHKLHNHGRIPSHQSIITITPNANSSANSTTNVQLEKRSSTISTNSAVIEYGFPSCSSYLIRSFRDNKFPKLQENGDVIVVDEKAKKSTTIPAGQFCIDGMYIENPAPTTSGNLGNNNFDGGNEFPKEDGSSQIPTYSGSEWHQGIIVCTKTQEITVDAVAWTLPLYAAVNHTAALFLMLTAIVYLLLWSYQNIHGWLQFAYAVSLFFAFSFLAVVQVWSQEFIENWPTLCFNLGWLIHFSILSSFFWLTSMNFDLWWRFRNTRYLLTKRPKPCSAEVKKFLFFAIFSFGIPVLLTGSAVLLDLGFDDPDLDFWIRLPRFGVKKCYFHDKKSEFPFLYLPIGLLLFVNLLCFSSTVLQLRNICLSVDIARSSSTLEDKRMVRLIAKLFIVMGVLWSFEFISWAASIAFLGSGSEELLIWLFMPTEIINSLQGIAIFVIFICKPNVMRKLSAKFGSLRCRQ